MVSEIKLFDKFEMVDLDDVAKCKHLDAGPVCMGSWPFVVVP